MTLYSFRNSVIPDLVGEQQLNVAKRAATKKLLKKYSTPEITEAEKVQPVVQQQQPLFDKDIDDNFNKLSDAFDNDNELLTTLNDLIIPSGWKPTADPTVVTFYEKQKKGKDEYITDVNQINKNYETIVKGNKKKIERDYERLTPMEDELNKFKNEIDYKKKTIDEYNKTFSDGTRGDILTAELEKLNNDLDYNKEEYKNLSEQKNKLESQTFLKPSSKIKKLDDLIIKNNAERMELKKQLNKVTEELRSLPSDVIQKDELNKLKVSYNEDLKLYNEALQELKTEFKKIEKEEKKIKKMEDDITNRGLYLQKQSQPTTSNKTIIQASKERLALFITTLNKFIKNIVNHETLFKNIYFEIKKVSEETLIRFEKSYNLLLGTFEIFKKSIISKDGNFKFYLEGLSSLKEKDIQNKFKLLLDYYDSLIINKDFIDKSINEYYLNYNILS
jgi:hypothetical protein